MIELFEDVSKRRKILTSLTEELFNDNYCRVNDRSFVPDGNVTGVFMFKHAGSADLSRAVIDLKESTR